jgi:hypothetical protein
MAFLSLGVPCSGEVLEFAAFCGLDPVQLLVVDPSFDRYPLDSISNGLP